ncbi:ribonuclease [Pseudofrankia sp. EUN1h]|nr:ribonuclease [Pseudofrankia sp. EUN1h]
MPSDDNQTATTAEQPALSPRRRRAAGRPAGPPSEPSVELPFEQPADGLEPPTASGAPVDLDSTDTPAVLATTDPEPVTDMESADEDELDPAAGAVVPAPAGEAEPPAPASEPTEAVAETSTTQVDVAPVAVAPVDTPPVDSDPAVQEAPAKAPGRSRARRAVRAVLTPVAPLPESEITAPVAAAPAEPSTAEAGAPAAGEATGEVEPTPVEAPVRRRSRAARRGASTPAEPSAETAQAPTAGTPTGAVPPAVGEPTAAVAQPVETPEISEPAAEVPAEAEPAAPAARTRRRAASRRTRATEEPAAGEVAEAEPSAQTDVPATQAPAAEAPAAEAPAVETPTAEAPARTGGGGRSAAPRWSAGSTFSAGFDTQESTPRVARRPVTAVTFQAPDLAAHEPPAPRGRERDRDRDRDRDRPRDGEQRPDRAAPEVAVRETEEATEAGDELVELAVLETGETQEPEAADAEAGLEDADLAGTRRRRRGRRGRGRARGDEDGFDTTEAATAEAGEGDAGQPAAEDDDEAEDDEADEQLAADTGDEDEDDDGRPGSRRRRRRRRRASPGGEETSSSPDDPPNTVVHVRETRRDDDLVRGVSGSTRLEAKRQRRREGRDIGRRRPPIVTESEFLARRESVERRMLVRNAGDRTQIAVLEDGVLVEHFVTRASSASYAGNVYLGRVQNVLASMEAAFVDIGKGRNAVLYAGEVNYDASGLEGRPRKIEQALKPGQSVLVQVSKDPIGHKGARLTSQISLPGRYLVYVPDGQSAGISRKLPDTERSRLKSILKKITPEDGGVIVRTAAEGASEQELERDIERLAAQWEDIARKAQKASAPALLYGEPDLVVRVIRDIFNEDFTELLVQGSGEAETIENYVDMVAPDLRPRVRRHVGTIDLFTEYRVDEQLAKALDRKVWLPSGGSLVIDRTEAMTVVDVNTGKFTGKGGNLEETVTKNNLEAAEEIVRQLRLRDIGGIIVIDFIDMVLESNRELVLRRLTECLGRDRTRHQVAEVTSLGLVQMTRKRVGQGLLEAYSEPCAHCNGRGVLIHLDGHQTPPPTPIPVPPLRRAGRRGAIPALAAATLGDGEQPGVAESDLEIPEAAGLPDGHSGVAGPGEAAVETTGGAEAGASREGGRRSRRARRATSQVISADVVPPAPTAAQQAEPKPAQSTSAQPVPAAAGTGWPVAIATGDDQARQASVGEPAGTGWPVNGAAAYPQGHQNGGAPTGATEDAEHAAPGGPTVFANSADPDSASVDAGSAGGRGRRPRRASRPVAKPTESVEASASAE